MSSSSTTSADDQREALLETLRGYKVRTAPSQLFPGQCGVVALAPIAKGESVFPCNGELSNDIINLTFEEVASLPSHSRKLVWAFFQPNHQDPRSVPREELTFPVPVNGLAHVGNSFFCNSADGTGQDANVETGENFDGSGYAELVATREIQVGEELLDSYPIWDYDGSGESLETMSGEEDTIELLGFGISDDEAQEILDLRHHMASLKAKVARLEELKDINEGQITGLKRQLDSTSSDNRELKTKVARLERAMADLKRTHEREVADLERKAAAGTSNSRLWWGCVNRFNTSSAGGYRDTSTTESESEDDDSVAGGIANGATDQANADDDVDVDVSTLCLEEEAISGEESNDDDRSPIASDQLYGGIGIIEDESEGTNQDDSNNDFPPPPPLPGQVVEAGSLPNANPARGGNNERWNERLGELRDFKAENGHCNVPAKQGPLGRWVFRQRQSYRSRLAGEQNPLPDERVATLDAIGFEWDGTGVDRTGINRDDERWNKRLGELRDYREENGNCNVPQSQGSLGSWVSKQRKLYRKRAAGKRTPLTDKRVAALEAIGFEWDGNADNDERWNEWLDELRKYKGENGHCNVPQSQGPLGNWVTKQRQEYRKRKDGGQSPLTDERVASLDAIDFEWDGTRANKERWNERLGELRKYKGENGHCNVPLRQGPLGAWVQTQRQEYQKRNDGKQTPLTDERVAALNSIGFEWDGSQAKKANEHYDALWNERLDELRDYKEENDHCDVPHSQGPLGTWVRKQRYLYKKRKDGEQTSLTDDRVAALNSIGFEWDGTSLKNSSKPNDDLWYKRLGELREYKEQNCHCNVPKKQGPLGTWVNMQRYLYRQRKDGTSTRMTDERVAALDAMGFEWQLK